MSRGQKGEETNRTHCLLFVTHLNLDNQCVIYRVKKKTERREERGKEEEGTRGRREAAETGSDIEVEITVCVILSTHEAKVRP